MSELRKNWIGILQAALLATISVIGGFMLAGLERNEEFHKETLMKLDGHIGQPGHREYMQWRVSHDKRIDQIEANQDKVIDILGRIDKTLTRIENHQ